MHVFAPARNQTISSDDNLGHVIYCIGLNGIFAVQKPFEMGEAHVGLLMDYLKNFKYASFLYLSSTRVYGPSADTGEESPLQVNPAKPAELYALSKLMGESICIGTGNPSVRIVRLSNVFGPDYTSSNFLPVMLRDAVTKKQIQLQSGLKSEKDYIGIDDVVNILPQIATSGKNRLYNVAFGKNTGHQELMNKLKEITGCQVEVQKDAVDVLLPRIRTDRLREEFNFSPKSILGELGTLTAQFEARFLSPAAHE